MARTVLALRITRTSTSEHPTHLDPFAVCQAFPGPDYYGASVAMGFPPLGDPAFRALLTKRSLEVGCSCPCDRYRRSHCPKHVPDVSRSRLVEQSRLLTRCSRAVSFTGWTLALKQFSLHPGDRASTGAPGQRTRTEARTRAKTERGCSKVKRTRSHPVISTRFPPVAEQPALLRTARTGLEVVIAEMGRSVSSSPLVRIDYSRCPFSHP
jgi:hypothetical protein